MILCHLESTWTQVYLQVITTILIFGLGIPTLILQATVQEDVRYIANKNQWKGLNTMIILPFLLSTFVFVLALFPCNRYVVYFWNTIFYFFPFPHYGDRFLAASVITLSIIGLVTSYYFQFYYRKNRIIRSLTKEIIKYAQQSGRLKIDPQKIEDFLYLGEHSQPGKEKEFIYREIKKIVIAIQSRKYYRAEGLNDFILMIETLLLCDKDINNSLMGLEIYNLIINNIIKKNSPPNNDVFLIIGSLGKLYQNTNYQAQKRNLKIMNVLKRIYEGLPTTIVLIAKELQRAGSYMLDHRTFTIAIGALNDLETMLSNKNGSAAMNAYLGLAAHFWHLDGAARRKAMESLQNNIDLATLNQQIFLASQYYYKTEANFEIVNYLEEMRMDLQATPEPKRPIVKLKIPRRTVYKRLSA